MSQGQILTCLRMEAQVFGIMGKKSYWILSFLSPLPWVHKHKYELFPAICPLEQSLKATWWRPIDIFIAISKLVKMPILQNERRRIHLWFMWHPSHVQDSHPTQASHPQRPTFSVSSSTLPRSWSPRLSTILPMCHVVDATAKPQTPSVDSAPQGLNSRVNHYTQSHETP